jgi:hypothetical protein
MRSKPTQARRSDCEGSARVSAMRLIKQQERLPSFGGKPNMHAVWQTHFALLMPER